MTNQNCAIYFSLLFVILFNSSNSFAQSKGSPAVKASEATPPEEMENTKFWLHGSLMFDKQTSEWLANAIKSHDQKIPIEILLPRLFPTTPQEPTAAEEVKASETEVADQINKIMDTPKEVPNFYLKSILYFSKNNWSLWLNDKKISDTTDSTIADKPSEDISVMSISANQAIFLWKKSEINRIYPAWKETFISIDDTKYSSPQKNIVVDASTGNISFILKPNQSLVTKTMEIVEGNAKNSVLQPTATTIPNTLNGANKAPQTIPNETKTLDKNNINPMNVIQNMETVNSILKQNVEKLR